MKKAALGRIVCAFAAVVTLAGAAHAQTQGMERRGDRRGMRSDARGAKQDCKAGDEKSRAECRQEKRGGKQDARHGTGQQAAPAANPAQ